MQRRVEATYGERARPGVALPDCADQDGVCSQVRAWEVVCGHARDGRGQGLGVWGSGGLVVGFYAGRWRTQGGKQDAAPVWPHMSGRALTVGGRYAGVRHFSL